MMQSNNVVPQYQAYWKFTSTLINGIGSTGYKQPLTLIILCERYVLS